MKRFVSIALMLVLCLALAVPVLADKETDLQEITALVKTTLEIDDDYTDFSGSYDDWLTPGWDLHWSDENRDLTVSCWEDGTVTYVSFWQSQQEPDLFYGFNAAFPVLDGETAEGLAGYWLDRLLAPGEEARIDAFSTSLSDGGYRFSGTVLINGLESPISFSLRIGEAGILSYNRSDSSSSYVGDIPNPVSQTAEEDAATALAETVDFELYYVSGEDGEARLQYVPSYGNYMVDADSGETIDRDALYADFIFGTSDVNVAAEEVSIAVSAVDAGEDKADLTEVELDSISNYADAMEKEELDAALRQISALGLEDFELQRCAYTMNIDTGDITASLRYTAVMTTDNLYGYSLEEFEEYSEWTGELNIRKTITVDAKTGELQSVSTLYPLWERDESAALPDEELQAAAENFLSLTAPGMFPETELCTLSGYDSGERVTYAQVHDGYFFPENNLVVAVNPADGTVDQYSVNWEDDVTFASSEGILSPEEARDTYIDALDLTLGYVAWPVAIAADDPVYAAYLDWGYTYIEALRLAWYYSGTGAVAGVDALTGEIISWGRGEEADNGTYEYDDLEDVPERECIEALATAGIGFAGGSFQPDQELTQRDGVTLLLQAAGYDAEFWSDEALQSEAVWLNLISAEDWTPEKTITIMDFLHMLVGASCYGYAASLSDIWSTEFDSLGDDAGTVAISAALGLIDKNDFVPDETCTRAAAAVILYHFMAR